jgi:hypothetical protein
MTLDAITSTSQIVAPTSEVPDDILDGLAIQAALRHLGPQGLDALRAAAEGHELNDAQRGLLRNGWNGALILAGDRLTRLGEQAYSTASKKLPVPERQSPQIEDQEREAQARQHQWRQQQLQSRNIAQREEARDQAETLARKIDALKEQEITIKASDAPELVKQESIEQVREQERDILREAPREVRARMPKRDRGMER